MAEQGSSGSGGDDQNNPKTSQEQQQQPPLRPPQPQIPAIFLRKYRDDEYMMYDFKTRECPQWLVTTLPHEPSVCPLLHEGHKRRRDPREFKYDPVLCPFLDNCEDGEDCEFSHNIYEYCLHPKKYRRSKCRDGENCNKYPCMFAHNPAKLLAAMKPPLAPPPEPQPAPLKPLSPLRFPIPAKPPVRRFRSRSA